MKHTNKVYYTPNTLQGFSKRLRIGAREAYKDADKFGDEKTGRLFRLYQAVASFDDGCLQRIPEEFQWVRYALPADYAGASDKAIGADLRILYRTGIIFKAVVRITRDQPPETAPVASGGAAADAMSLS